jgi:hypothetical protein
VRVCVCVQSVRQRLAINQSAHVAAWYDASPRCMPHPVFVLSAYSLCCVWYDADPVPYAAAVEPPVIGPNHGTTILLKTGGLRSPAASVITSLSGVSSPVAPQHAAFWPTGMSTPISSSGSGSPARSK